MNQELLDAIISAKTGDQAAFTYIYENTYKNAYYVALKYMNNEQDAQDVLQETYIKVMKNIATIEDPTTFNSWLSIIVANTAKNELRKKKPQLFSELDAENEEGEEFELQIEDEREIINPEIAYTKQETAEMVQMLLGDLSSEQKMAVIMFHFEGLSINEIATAMDCNLNTAKSRLNLGRKKLKESCENMKKKGYKLYSFSPITLLLWLLKQEYAGTATNVTIGLSGAAGEGSVTGGSVAGSTVGNIAGSTAGGAAAKSLLASVGAKVGVALTVALVSIGGLVALIKSNQSSSDKKVADDGSTKVVVSTEADVDVSDISDGDGVENIPKEEEPLYNALGFDAGDYIAVLNEKGKKETDLDGLKDYKKETPIAFCDLTGDGIPEMFIPDFNGFAGLMIFSTDAEGNCTQIVIDNNLWNITSPHIKAYDANMRNNWEYMIFKSSDGNVYAMATKDYVNEEANYNRAFYKAYWKLGVENQTLTAEEVLAVDSDNYVVNKYVNCRVNGVEVSIDEFNRAEYALENTVTEVIASSRNDRFDYVMAMGAKDLSMAWFDAYDYLQTGNFTPMMNQSTDEYPLPRYLNTHEQYDAMVIIRENNTLSVGEGRYADEFTISSWNKLDEFTYEINTDQGKVFTLYTPGKTLDDSTVSLIHENMYYQTHKNEYNLYHNVAQNYVVVYNGQAFISHFSN